MRTGDGRVITVAVELVEDADVTEARATCELGGRHFGGWGRARRSPGDPARPAVGEELATARALAELSTHLIDAAATTIEEHEGTRPRLHG